ncbi:hypothetical protein VaNZ11_011375 [Volvox africanus]|uniref:Nuclear/nucleolar GTPase 2 n=1 Tax=Volvox africanus TaxID=51714 RepID=A0ABQ5SCV1_9CHLO|nr:hypothetical protein VaNZ11_011375 [Volvox africanus]
MAKSSKSKAKGKPKIGGVIDNRKPKHSLDANRPSSGKGGMRDAATVRRLKMYRQRAVRDKNGRLLYQELQSKELPSTRIQPDRRWFGNTRVIGQKQLEQFRTEMSSKVNDAYTVLLREKKLPLQLLDDPDKRHGAKQARSSLLTTQPFADTFGPKKQRKRPKLAVESLEDLLQTVEDKGERYDDEKASVGPGSELEGFKDMMLERAYEKGQSKRIWGELYKVLDSSDVIVQVLDARDPNGTRCTFLEQHLRNHLRHKHIVLLLNKCDLVPSWVTKRWLHFLSREFPVLAFHASITNPFGKGALLSLLRQLARIRSDKQAISVGFVGYPNVGKSSVINTLRTKKVCKAAPIPGETKVWQYITLMKRIFCIDCPGVVYNRTNDTPTDLVLKGVVRVENLEDATHHVDPVLTRVKPEYLKRAYKIKEWADTEDFLAQLARLSGKLLRGGEPDLNTAARMILYDWQRGKIPFFTLPPDHLEEAPGTNLMTGNASPAAARNTVPCLPIPSELVTEEDAAKEAGAEPEAAAAAVRAVREVLVSATAAQARSAIPVLQDYYLPEDELRDGSFKDDAAVHPDVISSDGISEDEESSGDPSDASSSGIEPLVSDEDGLSGDTCRDGARGAVKEVKLTAAPNSRTPNDRKQKQHQDNGEDSDGYGDGGLSWEAVLVCMQGGEAPPSTDRSMDEEMPRDGGCKAFQAGRKVAKCAARRTKGVGKSLFKTLE